MEPRESPWARASLVEPAVDERLSVARAASAHSDIDLLEYVFIYFLIYIFDSSLKISFNVPGTLYQGNLLGSKYQAEYIS